MKPKPKRVPATNSVLDEIRDANRDLKPKLVRLKLRRMAADPFAFFRGTDHLFAARWAALAPADVGPSLLICGDLHLENFGAYRADDGEFFYDINDFDEALVAPCALDLVRCAASILLAAEVWKFSPVQAMRTVLTFLDRYGLAIAKAARTGEVGEQVMGTARGPIWGLLKRPMRGDQAAFLGRLTERDGPGRRRLARATGRFQDIGRGREAKVRAAVEAYGKGLDAPGPFAVRDVARRIAGIGSLGVRRYAVLVGVGDDPGRERLLDIKAARPPALGPWGDPRQPEAGGSDARRVVQAQRQLQARPGAGLDVLAIGRREYRMRELIPEENRTSLAELRKEPGRLRRAVAVAGRLTAWAHIRGGRWDGGDRSADLARWAAGPALEAVIASAVRHADRVRRDYRAFLAAGPKSRTP